MKPVVDGLAQEFSDRVDFVIYANADASEEISEFTTSKGVAYVPTMMLVSPEGVELARWEGVALEDELRAMLEEAP
jgi:hypothetical protein